MRSVPLTFTCVVMALFAIAAFLTRALSTVSPATPGPLTGCGAGYWGPPCQQCLQQCAQTCDPQTGDCDSPATDSNTNSEGGPLVPGAVVGGLVAGLSFCGIGWCMRCEHQRS